jgi:hypothetical protein
VLLLCHALGIDPASLIRDKLRVHALKYPVDTSRGRGDKRAAYAPEQSTHAE